MTQTQSPSYIKALLAPTKSGTSRRAWSIDVESVWVPFFTATNEMGETNLADDVLGAPIRLAKSPDGEVRFTNSGRPVMRVHPELNSQIGIVRENFVAGLLAYTGSVREERPDAYVERVSRQYVAGLPIKERDATDVSQAIAKLAEQAREGEPASESGDSSESAGEGEHTPTPEQLTDAAAEKPARQSRNRAKPEPASTPAS